MNTLHHWFRSGDYLLLGHTDVPANAGPLGVVIVSPFGWEEVCSYRPLRFVARILAANNIPVLRFDLPGTGNSSGGPHNCGLLKSWMWAVRDAIGQLRQIARVGQVALFGIGLGGLPAVAAAASGADAEAIVLWGTPPSGRRALRELRAFASMERRTSANGTPIPLSVPSFEAGGFLITPEFERDLEALDLETLLTASPFAPAPPPRVLLLSRDDLAPDRTLIECLRSAGCTVQVAPGAGFSDMMAVPHEALPPVTTAQSIADFLTKECAATARPPLAGDPPALASSATVDGSGVESIYDISYGSESMFGLLAEPLPGTEPRPYLVLLLNAGGVRHIGPNRMWVALARRWARAGVASLRLDLCGIGESDGAHNLDIPRLYHERMVEQVEWALDSVRSRLGFRQFAVVGLCAGAFWGFHAALRSREIRAAILLNPRLLFWDPEAERRRILERAARGLVHWKDWLRVVRGGIQRADLKRAVKTVLRGFPADADSIGVPAFPDTLNQAWQVIKRQQTRLTFLFTEGEPLLREMEDQGQLPSRSNPLVNCIRIGPQAGHTFRPQWAQKLAHEAIDRELMALGQDTTVTEIGSPVLSADLPGL
jgi:pimeloyl-ACP methyl ester carboxylesterase